VCNTTFSCNRCVDIHNAQRAGCSGLPCQCSCHNGFSWMPNYTLNITGAESTDDTDSSLTLCTPNGCSVINLN